MPLFSTILAAVQAGITLIPEGEALVKQLSSLFSTSDQAALEAAHATALAAANAQHNEAQSL